MPVAVGGLSHKAAELELREKLAFSGAELERGLSGLASGSGLEELVVLSTCNRTELYAYGRDREELSSGIERILGARSGAAVSLSDRGFYCFFNRRAVAHLFRVASSLDSLVLGESQILGQVRQAYRMAQGSRTAGRVLSRLFQQAVKVGKRARRETSIGSGAVSVSSAAVDLAGKIFGSLAGREALILGAGEMSELTLSLLIDSGVERVFVSNRTYARAVELAEAYHGTAVGFEEFTDLLSRVDILISSTGAEGYVLEGGRAGSELSKRDRPIFIIDLAVPRDIDPTLAEHDNCFLYNIDDLETVVEKNLEERRAQAGPVEEIVTQEADAFMKWYDSLAVVPLIQSIHGHMNRIRSEEVEKVLAKLEHLSEDDRALVEKMSVQILKKILHDPTSRIREHEGKLTEMHHIELVRYIFGLDKGDPGGSK